jgi:hemerythrin
VYEEYTTRRIRTMAALAWSDAFATRIFEIDVQHKKLFKMVNELETAMQEGKGKLVLGRLLEDLVHYTRSHFRTEEGFMEKSDYPEYGEHKDKHDKMTRKVLEVQKAFQAGQTHITIDVMRFLQNWLTEHILKTDLKFARFLNDREAQGKVQAA